VLNIKKRLRFDARPMIPDPPSYIGAPGITAWRTGYAACTARGQWEPVFRYMLGLFASSAERYCDLVIEARAHQLSLSPETAAEIAQLRILVRQMMTDWFLLPVARVPLAEIRADGLDADIASLCGIASIARP